MDTIWFGGFFVIQAPIRKSKKDIVQWNIHLGGGFKYFVYFHPYLGKWSNLTNIFQMGWNHQPVIHFSFQCPSVRSRILSDPSFTNGSFLHSDRPLTCVMCQKILKRAKGKSGKIPPATVFFSVIPGTSVTNTPGVHDDPWHTWRCPTFCRFGAWPCRRVGMVGTCAARTPSWWIPWPTVVDEMMGYCKSLEV